MVLTEVQLQHLADFFFKTTLEGGMELPSPQAAGGITMESVDKTLTLYRQSPLLRAIVARTVSAVEMAETARNQARLLLATPTRAAGLSMAPPGLEASPANIF